MIRLLYLIPLYILLTLFIAVLVNLAGLLVVFPLPPGLVIAPFLSLLIIIVMVKSGLDRNVPFVAGLFFLPVAAAVAFYFLVIYRHYNPEASLACRTLYLKSVRAAYGEAEAPMVTSLSYFPKLKNYRGDYGTIGDFIKRYGREDTRTGTTYIYNKSRDCTCNLVTEGGRIIRAEEECAVIDFM